MKTIGQLLIAAAMTLVCAGATHAGLVSSRADLRNFLGGTGTIENFEAYQVTAGSANLLNCGAPSTSELTAATLCDGQGPGLVNSNLTFSKGDGRYQWNGTGYQGANSQELLVAQGNSPFGIGFNSAVTAFGLDLRTFAGSGASETSVWVFGSDNGLLGTWDISLGNDGASVFAGWESAGGIGGFLLSSTGKGWSPIIDNIEWGGTPGPANEVPEPESLALVGLAMVGLGLARHKAKRA